MAGLQSAALLMDASSDIPLSQMTSSVAGERRPNATVIAAQGRDEKSIAAAAASDEDIPAIRRAATESKVHQMTPPTKTHLVSKPPLKKARMLLLIMFLLQAMFPDIARSHAGERLRGCFSLYPIPAYTHYYGGWLMLFSLSSRRSCHKSRTMEIPREIDMSLERECGLVSCIGGLRLDHHEAVWERDLLRRGSRGRKASGCYPIVQDLIHPAHCYFMLHAISLPAIPTFNTSAISNACG